MESVEFWGISFRSDSHMRWFKISIALFVLSFVWYIATTVILTRRTDFIGTKTTLWTMLLFFHTVAACEALVVVAINFATNEPVNGKVFSIDCIWFNALMAAVYFFLCWITKISAVI